MIAMLVTLKMFSMLGAHVLDVPKSDQLDVNGRGVGLTLRHFFVLSIKC